MPASALNDPLLTALLAEFVHGQNKEQALLEIGKKRELYPDLALVLWHSFGVMPALLAEIVSVYPMLSPPNVTSQHSNRVCNALALLQCVASHPETRLPLLHAQVPLFLYPLLNCQSTQKPVEYLRLTSLGVLGALAKADSPEVVAFLLSTEAIPLCLKIMERSSDLNKTVAIFILQRILADDAGFAYVCQTMDRFEAVSRVLQEMVRQLQVQQQQLGDQQQQQQQQQQQGANSRLLRHILKCYTRMCDWPEGKLLLQREIPQAVRDDTFEQVYRDDAAAKEGLTLLLSLLQM